MAVIVYELFGCFICKKGTYLFIFSLFYHNIQNILISLPIRVEKFVIFARTIVCQKALQVALTILNLYKPLDINNFINPKQQVITNKLLFYEKTLFNDS
jgi:hypothetical protein